jgi:hypothetical protein
MPWEGERNIRSLSPHGLKESSGHARPGVHDLNSVGCPEMPSGILSMTPIGAGKSSPYAPTSSRAPKDAPQEMRPPHNPAPHRYGGDPKAPNTYGKVRR